MVITSSTSTSFVPGVSQSTGQLSLAQRLAHNDKKVRDSSVKKLRLWLLKRQSLDVIECLKIWKGLFYCYWLADKTAVQQELASRLAALLKPLSEERNGVFWQSFALTMAREWNGIDQLRMDKFMSLVRKFLACQFSVMQENRWDEKIWENRWESLIQAANMDKKGNEGAGRGYFLHITDCLLTELSPVFEGNRQAAASFGLPHLLALLQPFFRILSIFPDESLVERTKLEITERLMGEAEVAARRRENPGEGRPAKRAKKNKKKQDEEENDENPSTFLGELIIQEAEALAKKTFQLASNKSTIERRRAYFYSLNERLQAFADRFAPKAPQAAGEESSKKRRVAALIPLKPEKPEKAPKVKKAKAQEEIAEIAAKSSKATPKVSKGSQVSDDFPEDFFTENPEDEKFERLAGEESEENSDENNGDEPMSEAIWESLGKAGTMESDEDVADSDEPGEGDEEDDEDEEEFSDLEAMEMDECEMEEDGVGEFDESSEEGEEAGDSSDSAEDPRFSFDAPDSDESASTDSEAVDELRALSDPNALVDAREAFEAAAGEFLDAGDFLKREKKLKGAAKIEKKKQENVKSTQKTQPAAAQQQEKGNKNQVVKKASAPVAPAAAPKAEKKSSNGTKPSDAAASFKFDLSVFEIPPVKGAVKVKDFFASSAATEEFKETPKKAAKTEKIAQPNNGNKKAAQTPAVPDVSSTTPRSVRFQLSRNHIKEYTIGAPCEIVESTEQLLDKPSPKPAINRLSVSAHKQRLSEESERKHRLSEKKTVSAGSQKKLAFAEDGEDGGKSEKKKKRRASAADFF